MVKGTAAAVKGTEQILDTAALYLFPWQAGKKDVFVRVSPRLHHGPPVQGHRPDDVVDPAQRSR